MSEALKSQINKWKQDPVAFVRDVLVDPETDKPFELYPAEETFLREGFTLTPEGRLPYPELVFSAPKKSGKTALAAICTIYTIVVLSGKFAEGYCVANDLDQSKGRVFQAVGRILGSSPLLTDSARVLTEKAEFPSTGATVTALPNDFKGAAGGNPNFTTFEMSSGLMSAKTLTVCGMKWFQYRRDAYQCV